MDKLLRRLQI